MDPTHWLPFYPDLPARVKSRLEPWLASQPPYNTGIFPVPDILAGLTFLPRFPDLVPHERVTREQTVVTTAAIFATAVAPIAWLPNYPSIMPRSRLPVAAMPPAAEAPPGAQIVIAQSLAWNADYPDRAPLVVLRRQGGAFSTVTPLVAASTIVCTELVRDVLTQPLLITEALPSPVALTESLGTPRFLFEALC